MNTSSVAEKGYDNEKVALEKKFNDHEKRTPRCGKTENLSLREERLVRVVKM